MGLIDPRRIQTIIRTAAGLPTPIGLLEPTLFAEGLAMRTCQRGTDHLDDQRNTSAEDWYLAARTRRPDSVPGSGDLPGRPARHRGRTALRTAPKRYGGPVTDIWRDTLRPHPALDQIR